MYARTHTRTQTDALRGKDNFPVYPFELIKSSGINRQKSANTDRKCSERMQWYSSY